MSIRPITIGAAALLFACAPERNSAENVAAPAGKAPKVAPAMNRVAPDESFQPLAPADPPGDYPGVAEMSPSQRRAYERGWRDCREGRYEPGEWAEAYRIGCAAAQEGR